MKRLLSILALSTWVCASPTFARATESSADKSTSKTGATSSATSAPPAAAPTQAMLQMQRLLKKFSGTWSITEDYAPSQWAPKGATGKGEEIWKSGPGGLSLVEDYSSNGSTGEFHGMSVTWWDEAAQGYRAIWCDSQNPEGCIYMTRLGKWEGDRLVLGDERDVNGKKVIFKETVSDITPTSFTQTIYAGEIEGSLKRTVTIKATKTGG